MLIRCQKATKFMYAFYMHQRRAGAPDRDLTARAASCQSCPLRTLLSTDADRTPGHTIMTRRGSAPSPIPQAWTDTPFQSGLTSVPGPLLTRAQRWIESL